MVRGSQHLKRHARGASRVPSPGVRPVVCESDGSKLVAFVLRHELVDVVLASGQAVGFERGAQLGTVHESGTCGEGTERTGGQGRGCAKRAGNFIPPSVFGVRRFFEELSPSTRTERGLVNPKTRPSNEARENNG